MIEFDSRYYIGFQRGMRKPFCTSITHVEGVGPQTFGDILNVPFVSEASVLNLQPMFSDAADTFPFLYEMLKGRCKDPAGPYMSAVPPGRQAPADRMCGQRSLWYSLR